MVGIEVGKDVERTWKTMKDFNEDGQSLDQVLNLVSAENEARV
jgi:hypothetical protein